MKDIALLSSLELLFDRNWNYMYTIAHLKIVIIDQSELASSSFKGRKNDAPKAQNICLLIGT